MYVTRIISCGVILITQSLQGGGIMGDSTSSPDKGVNKADISRPNPNVQSVANDYLSQLQEIRKHGIDEGTSRMLDVFFNSLQQQEGLFKPSDLILLDRVCKELVQVVKLEADIAKNGMIIHQRITAPDGHFYIKHTTNPAVDMMRKLETQLRSNLRELGMTRKEQRIGGTARKDVLAELISMDNDSSDGKDDGKSGGKDGAKND